jgi:hypothetical protein
MRFCLIIAFLFLLVSCDSGTQSSKTPTLQGNWANGSDSLHIGDTDFSWSTDSTQITGMYTVEWDSFLVFSQWGQAQAQQGGVNALHYRLANDSLILQEYSRENKWLKGLSSTVFEYQAVVPINSTSSATKALSYAMTFDSDTSGVIVKSEEIGGISQVDSLAFSVFNSQTLLVTMAQSTVYWGWQKFGRAWVVINETQETALEPIATYSWP